MKEFCPFLDEFIEAREKDLFRSKQIGNTNVSLLKKFFVFLKENEVECLEESFFDENKSELATKFLEETRSWEISKGRVNGCKRMTREFLRYCSQEHLLICYDQVRKENASRILQILSEEATHKRESLVNFPGQFLKV